MRPQEGRGAGGVQGGQVVAQQRPGGGQQRREFTPACDRGDRCGYLANGCCNFFHPGVGVQKPREEGRWGQQGPRGRGQGGHGGQGGHREQDFTMRRQFQLNY